MAAPARAMEDRHSSQLGSVTSIPFIRRHPASRSGGNASSPASDEAGLLQSMSGGVLLSHDLAVAVPSALKGLTSGFGMGPGVSLSLWPP